MFPAFWRRINECFMGERNKAAVALLPPPIYNRIILIFGALAGGEGDVALFIMICLRQIFAQMRIFLNN